MSRKALLGGAEVATAPFASVLEQAGDGQGRLSHEQRRRVTLNDIKKQAYDAGFAEGRAAGFEVGKEEGREEGYRQGNAHADAIAGEAYRAEVEKFALDLVGVAALVQAAMERFFEQGEREMESLIRGILSDALALELKMNEEALLNLVRSAMSEATLAPKAKIRLNPFDCARLKDKKDLLLQATRSVRQVELVEDPTILGGCVIETDGGVIDASTQGMMQRFSDEQEAA